MLRWRARHRHDHRAPVALAETGDVRAAWVRRVLAHELVDLDALDDLQAALVQSAAEAGEVEPDDPRLAAATDVLGAMELLEPGEPQIAWVRGQLVADLGRPGEAVHDLLDVVRRCTELAARAAADRAADLEAWADAARGRAGLAFAHAGQPLAAAAVTRHVRDVHRRDDVVELLERWESTGDARFGVFMPLLEGAEPDLEAIRHLQAVAAKQALDGSPAASDAVLDVLAAMAVFEPDEPAHPWNRGALLFELERPAEAAGDKLECARRMEVNGEEPGEIDRARFHACLGRLLADHPLTAAVLAARLQDPSNRAEADRLLDDWLTGD